MKKITQIRIPKGICCTKSSCMFNNGYGGCGFFRQINVICYGERKRCVNCLAQFPSGAVFDLRREEKRKEKK